MRPVTPVEEPPAKLQQGTWAVLTAPYLALPTEGQQELHLPEAEPEASSLEFLALKLSPAHTARVDPILGDQPMP